jgi:predicted methyltransferase
MTRAPFSLTLALAGVVIAGACNRDTSSQGAAAPPTPPPAQETSGRLFPPSELGVLEAPDRAMWQQPERVMDALNIADSSRVADVGAGGGWFTTYLARRVGPNGVVYAEDVQPAMIDSIIRKMKAEGLNNVRTILGTPEDPNLPEGLQAILMVDTYPQLSNPVAMLKRLSLSLAPGGRIGVVDFKNDGAGGPGPPLESRVAPETVMKNAQQAGLTLSAQERFLRYQYMLVFTR